MSESITVERDSYLYISMKYYVDIHQVKLSKRRKAKQFDFTIKSLDSIESVDPQELLDIISSDVVKTLTIIQHSDVNWSYSKLHSGSQEVLCHTLLTSYRGEITTQKSKVPKTGFFMSLLTKRNIQPHKVTIHGVPTQVLDSSSEYGQRFDKLQLFLTRPFNIPVTNLNTGESIQYSFQYVKGYMNSLAMKETADIAVPSGWFSEYKTRKNKSTKTKRGKS